jgi:hypothetical protein
MAQAGVTGTWRRMVDRFCICTEVNMQKIGDAVEPIPGKVEWFADDLSNRIHLGGRVHSAYGSSIG